MSRTNCLRPSSGFCLNLRVRMVNSDMALACVLGICFQRGCGVPVEGAGDGRALLLLLKERVPAVRPP